MTFEQMEGSDVDQLRLPLESSEHIGDEAGRRVLLTRAILADVALGVDEVDMIGRPKGA